jgi:adenylate kinase family enzyme
MEGIAEMKRVVVVGTSCSGKTTLARDIASILEIPHFELDVLHWGPNWTCREYFEENVTKAVQNPSWTIDGNYRKVRDLIWDRVDTIIWLNYSFSLVFWRALKRTIPRVFLKQTIFAGNRETFRIAFFSSDSILWWVIKTYRKRIKEYSKLFSGNQFPNIKIIEFRHPKQADKFLHDLKTNREKI